MENIHKEPRSTKIIFIIAFSAVILVGILLRISGISHSLEYDEIWTIRNWLPLDWLEILTTLSPPNNHPLNSVLMKLFTLHSAGNIVLLRLPNLICGIALLPLVYWLTKTLTGNRQAAIVSMAFTAFAPGLIHYSHCARGYSMATFGITLFAFLSSYCILNYSKLKTKQRIFIVAALAVCMMATCMTFSASILFIAPIMLIHLACILKKYWHGKSMMMTLKMLILNHKELICSWVIMTVFASWLYIGHYHEFQSGMGIAAGVTVNSLKSFIVFLNQLFPKLLFWPILPLVFISIFDKRQAGLFYCFCFIVLFPFISIIFTKGGPPRVYLPILPFMLILAACGLLIISESLLRLFKSENRNFGIAISYSLAAAVIIPSIHADEWPPVDWFESFASIEKIPKSTMMVYGACETYALAHNINAKAYVDNFSRINSMKSGQKIIFFNIANQMINGTNSHGGEAAYKIIEKGKFVKVGNLPSTMYKLKKIIQQSSIKNKTLIAKIPFIPLKFKDAAVSYLFTMPESKWLLLNFFLTVPTTVKKQKYSSAILICSNGHKLNAKQLLAIEYKSKGKLRFYTLKP